jgi:hypothetical protein
LLYFATHTGLQVKLGDNFYWVSASDQNCNGKFGWCEIDRPFSTWIKWNRNEPDTRVNKDENCVAIYYIISLMKGDRKASFIDSKCNSNSLFICEVCNHKITLINFNY